MCTMFSVLKWPCLFIILYIHWHVEGIENTNTRETENKNCQYILLPHHSLYKGPFCTYVTFWDFPFSIIDCRHSHVIACSPKHDFQAHVEHHSIGQGFQTCLWAIKKLCWHDIFKLLILSCLCGTCMLWFATLSLLPSVTCSDLL